MQNDRKEQLIVMSDDPIEDGINKALSMNTVGANLMMKLLPFLLVCCAIDIAARISVTFGAVFGLGYGIYLFFQNNWLEVRDIKAKLAKRRKEKGKERQKFKWQDVKEIAYVVFLVVALGYNSILEKLQTWFALKKKDENGYVHPGDDQPPVLEMRYIKLLFGPHWLLGLFLLCRGLIVYFLVVCCIWGIWLSVGLSFLVLGTYSLAYPACRDVIGTFVPSKGNG